MTLLISDDMIVVEIVCLCRYATVVDVIHGSDYVSLVSSHVLLGVVVYNWIVVVYYYE
jgi:hypothetical protein